MCCELTEESEEREVSNLVRFARKTENISKIMIVTAEEESTVTRENIQISVVPAYKFLVSGINA